MLRKVQDRIADSPYVVKMLLLALCYYLGVHLGLYLSFPESDIGSLWPPSALLLSVLLASPRRQWVGLVLATVPAQLAAELPRGIPMATSLWYFAGSVVAVVLVAALIESILGRRLTFERLAEAVMFVVAAVLVGPVVAAFIGVAASGATVLDPAYWSGVRTWILSDALTHMAFTPLLVTIFNGRRRRYTGGGNVGWFERTAVAVALVLACIFVFFHDPATIRQFRSLYYVPIPILVWAAVRLGPGYCFGFSSIIAMLAVWAASRGYGPFGGVLGVRAIMDLQAFLLLSLTPIALLATTIADQRWVAHALRDSEEKYRLLVDHAGDMVVKTDIDGKLLYVSSEYCRVFGKSEAELLRQSYVPLVHEDDRAATQASLEALKRPPYRSYVEQRALTCRGWQWIAWRGTAVLDEQGQVIATIGVGRNIQALKDAEAERQRLHERLSRAEKMEALNLLAGGVAHDLNNILSGVISYPDLLLLDIPKDSEMREPLETIRQSGFRAAAVVRDMANLTRVMDANTSLIPANLSRMMSEYLGSREFRDLADQHASVNLTTQLDPGVLSISCAPAVLRRAISNLVLNAVEIAEPDGDVIIRVTNRYLDEPLQAFEEVPGGEYVLLEAMNSGAQIAPEDLPRVFDPFFTRKVLGWGGSGLGLTVVWNVVHDHGGYVNVTNREHGTAFSLYLPATRAAAQNPTEPEEAAQLAGNGEHILVVDDEPAQCRIARHILERLNYRVETESNGEAAVEHLKAYPVDLVLLDMIMPGGLDGEETYRRMCALHPHLKAVVASGFAHRDVIRAMRDAGVTRYIEKPYTLARLGREVYAELHADRG